MSLKFCISCNASIFCILKQDPDMALLGSRDRNGVAHMVNEITGGDGQEDYDVPPPAVSVRKVQQLVREKEIEATSEKSLWVSKLKYRGPPRCGESSSCCC